MEQPTQKQFDKLANPTHLATAPIDDLRQAAEKAAGLTTPPQVDVDDPRLREQYRFEFDWTDGRGRRKMGTFVNKILTVGERQAVGMLRAQLAGGMPVDAVDEVTREVNLMVAHLEFSLVERPDWAQDLRKLKDARLLYRVYEEVASHEATFFGWPQATGEGEA